MKKLIKTLILGFFVLNFLYGEEGEIDLVPVYEKTFPDTIVDVIFDTATVSINEAKNLGWKVGSFSVKEKILGKLNVVYPKVIITATYKNLKVKGIKFYNYNGDLINYVEVSKKEKVYKSSRGVYILIGKWPDEYHPEWQGGKLYNKDGKLIKEYQEYFPVAVSDEGYVIAGELPFESEPPGDFIFYNPQGIEVGRVHNPLSGSTGWAVAKFTEDQEYVIIGYTDTYSKSALIIVHKDGKILWQREFDRDAFHRDSEVIGINKFGISGISQDNTSTFCYFYDWSGKMKWETPLEIRGDMIINISKDKKKLYVASGIGYLWCIDIGTGKIRWTYKEPWAPVPGVKDPWPWEVPRFRKLEIIGGILWVLGKQGRDWHSSTLFAFDGENGKLLKKTEYPKEKITLLTQDGKIGLLNITQSKIFFFKIEGGEK